MARVRTTDLQVRGIPVSLRERLRRRAERKGVSMSQYVIERLDADLALPTLDEWLDEVAALPKVDLGGLDVAELMREDDEERTEELIRRSRSSSTRPPRSTS
ncbi:MAG: hypothetical protein AAB295_03125 [Chloroflexota bacterium]